MKKILQLFAILIFILGFTGCFSSGKNEIPVLGNDLSIKSNNVNETKLVIFNDSNFVLFGTDTSGNINIKLNGKNVPQLGVGHYMQVIIPKGICRVDLVHWKDMMRFSSQNRIAIAGSESFLRIFATADSNEAEIVAALPSDFEKKFKPMK